MKTKYDVGQEVGIKGTVRSVHIDLDGIHYQLKVGDFTIALNEEELSDIIDLEGIEG